jgi:hypothetical protein
LNYYLEKSIKIGSVDALFYLGNYYDDMKDYDKMIDVISTKSNINELSVIYDNDDDEINTNHHINFKNNHKSYILQDNDKLRKEKQKYNDIIKDLEEIF